MSGTPEVPDFLLEELGSQAPGLEENDESELNDDVARLTRWWLQEEAAPELLPFQTQTVEDLYAVVEEQQGFVDVSKTSVAEASSALLYQMEIDRVKYLLSRYLRARLRKLEKYILHVALDPDMRQRLSPQELRFAGQYLDLMVRKGEQRGRERGREGGGGGGEGGKDVVKDVQWGGERGVKRTVTRTPWSSIFCRKAFNL
ncbi:hypothetical protein NSK_008462 [Nannochloropsis salina CCMP1776]|uniref:GINS subunit domain-containing protein n=1 Tax=Nannochloropsis salina CCMP1776 TaxID=1027361 RepID=A0A4D9CN54_9STRA|nr:hypothetical protein NSK_008462 [Nannochloropsis salina CCMP1776]|eukprot:TFJ80196.1 hypothetical protein NSK_008462 [Nannochloropsis salina CCMP1776]